MFVRLQTLESIEASTRWVEKDKNEVQLWLEEFSRKQ